MVYVDPMTRRFVSPTRRGVMVSWLIADTEAELHAFAATIGLKREWCLRSGFIRYDLGGERRARAIAAGAVEITAEQFLAWLEKHRATRADRKTVGRQRRKHSRPKST